MSNPCVSKGYSLGELAEILVLSFQGESTCRLLGLATLQNANASDLSFLASTNYAKYLPESKAAAVILNPVAAELFTGNCLIAPNPYLAFAKASALFDAAPTGEQGISPHAVVDPLASVHASASIAAGAVIAAGVTVGEGVRIGANCVIGADSIILDRTQLHANVTIAYGVSLGTDCIIHSGAVIGADGFGFAPNKTDDALAWVKIHQLGGVRVGNSVEIGANTTIDRGALDDTVIADGVKVDNQCQIAHNVVIGEHTAIAAATAIAGSTTIGKSCTIAGCVGIVGHIEITDNVHIAGMTMVSKSISTAGSYSSSIPAMDTGAWRKNAVRIRQLDKIAKRLSALEKSS